MTSLQKLTMPHLPDQEFFEALLLKSQDERLPKVPERIVVWFSATWCGPCRRVDGDQLMSAFSKIQFYKCDVDENNYTPGYCNVRSIPSFLAIEKGKVIGNYQNSDTDAIAQWIRSVFTS